MFNLLFTFQYYEWLCIKINFLGVYLYKNVKINSFYIYIILYYMIIYPQNLDEYLINMRLFSYLLTRYKLNQKCILKFNEISEL